MLINDPDGQAARVNKDGALHVVQTEDEVFVLTSAIAVLAAADTALWMRNDYDDVVMEILSIVFGSDKADAIEVASASGGDDTTGTGVIPTSLDRTNIIVPKITARTDETANTQGTLLHTERLAADDTARVMTNGALKIGPSQELVIDVVGGNTALAEITVTFKLKRLGG